MMRRILNFISYFLGIAAILLAIGFTVGNLTPVAIGLYPFAFALEVELALALYGALGLGAVIGIFVTWLGGLKGRWRARNLANRVQQLEQENQEIYDDLLKAQDELRKRDEATQRVAAYDAATKALTEKTSEK